MYKIMIIRLLDVDRQVVPNIAKSPIPTVVTYTVNRRKSCGV